MRIDDISATFVHNFYNKKQNNVKVVHNDVNISSEGLKRLNDDIKIEDKAKSSLRIDKNNNGQFVYKFIDKETKEVIREIPLKDAQDNYKRIQDFLDKVIRDL